MSIAALALVALVAAVGWFRRRETSTSTRLSERSRFREGLAAHQFVGLDLKWPEPDSSCESVDRTNEALEDASLPYWIACDATGGDPILETFEIEDRATWRDGDQAVEVRRLRRLWEFRQEARSNRSLPVAGVMMDALESDILADVGTDPDLQDNRVDLVGQEQWQKALASKARSFERGQNAVYQRAKVLKQLAPALSQIGVPADWSVSFVLSQGLTDLLRDCPAVPSPTVADLEKRSAALQVAPAVGVLGTALDGAALRAERRQAWLRLERVPTPLPDLLGEEIGTLDDELEVATATEVRAWLGAIHDDPSPREVIGDMARIAWGDRANQGAESSAARVVLSNMRPAHTDEVAALRRLTALSPYDLQDTAQRLHLQFFGSPLPLVTRDLDLP